MHSVGARVITVQESLQGLILPAHLAVAECRAKGYEKHQWAPDTCAWAGSARKLSVLNPSKSRRKKKER